VPAPSRAPQVLPAAAAIKYEWPYDLIYYLLSSERRPTGVSCNCTLCRSGIASHVERMPKFGATTPPGFPAALGTFAGERAGDARADALKSIDDDTFTGFQAGADQPLISRLALDSDRPNFNCVAVPSTSTLACPVMSRITLRRGTSTPWLRTPSWTCTRGSFLRNPSRVPRTSAELP
jgi:hypothetical protein